MLGSLIGTGISLVASGIGTYFANKKKREAQEEYEAHMDEQLNDINREINTNYLDRADARNAIRKVTDSNTEALRQLNTDAIRGGATDEAKVAMASQLNKRTAEVVGDLSAMGERHKDALRQEKRQMEAAKAGYKYSIASDTSGLDTMIGAISSAAQTLGSAWDDKRAAKVAGVGETKPVVSGVTVPSASASVQDALTSAPQVKYGSIIR